MRDHDPDMRVIEAIYARRSVRSYTREPVDRETVQALLAAAIHAPTAMHEEPWAFSVIQDRALLMTLSNASKEITLRESEKTPTVHALILQEAKEDPNYDVFHGAGTLIVIWCKPLGPFAVGDCWLAAENLMLASTATGLGTCVMGFAVSALNTLDWKKRLGVPNDWSAVAPIIVGVPTGPTPPVPRKPAEIASWQDSLTT